MSPTCPTWVCCYEELFLKWAEWLGLLPFYFDELLILYISNHGSVWVWIYQYQRGCRQKRGYDVTKDYGLDSLLIKVASWPAIKSCGSRSHLTWKNFCEPLQMGSRQKCVKCGLSFISEELWSCGTDRLRCHIMDLVKGWGSSSWGTHLVPQITS